MKKLLDILGYIFITAPVLVVLFVPGVLYFLWNEWQYDRNLAKEGWERKSWDWGAAATRRCCAHCGVYGNRPHYPNCSTVSG